MGLFSFIRFCKIKSGFIANECGSLGVGMALSIIPVLALSVGAIFVTDLLARETRLHATSCAAVLAVAKEGDMASEEVRQAMLTAWTNQNLQALKRAQDLPDCSLFCDNDVESLVANTKPDLADHGKLLKSFSQCSLLENVSAERFYVPIELAIVFSAGANSNDNQVLKKQAVVRAVQEVFSHQKNPGDVHVNLIQYSAFVNVGLDYADKLIKPQSRHLQPPFVYNARFKKTQSAYAYQTKALRDNGLMNLITDLLGKGGPADTYGMVGVARPTLRRWATPSEIERYMQRAEEPPRTPSDGFDLLMIDGRHLVEDDTMGIMQLDWDRYGGFFRYLQASYLDKVEFYKDDVLDFAVLPKVDVNGAPVVVPSERRAGCGTRSAYGGYCLWGAETTYPYGPLWPQVKPWFKFRDGVVALPSGIPKMPILIGATSEEAVLKHLEAYEAETDGDGPDEGLLWALRSLSPEWGAIWDKGDNFPAPWDSGVEKRLVLIAAGTTFGYYGGSSGHPDIISAASRRLKERGIKTYIVTTRSKRFFYTGPQYRHALARDEDIHYATRDNLADIFQDLAKRSYRVRLSSAVPL